MKQNLSNYIELWHPYREPVKRVEEKIKKGVTYRANTVADTQHLDRSV